MLVQSVQLMAVGRSLSVTLWMRTEYHMSGSTSVTSREKGAIQDTVIVVALLLTSNSPTAESVPIENKVNPCAH